MTAPSSSLVLPDLDERVPFTYREVRDYLRQGVQAWDGPPSCADDTIRAIQTSHAENREAPSGPTPAEVFPLLTDLLDKPELLKPPEPVVS